MFLSSLSSSGSTLTPLKRTRETEKKRCCSENSTSVGRIHDWLDNGGSTRSVRHLPRARTFQATCRNPKTIEPLAGR